MKTHSITTLLAAVATGLCCAGAARAQEADRDDWMKLADPVTRDSVGDARDKALAASRRVAVANGDSWMLVPTTRTRQEVVAELEVARQSGELARLNAEAPDFDPPGVPVRRIARAAV